MNYKTAAISLAAFIVAAVASGPANAANGVPAPSHIVVVMEENHSYDEIMGSTSAPYINSLAQQGALFTQSFAIEHPSQPNYLDLFSGTDQGVTSDDCPQSFTTANLGAELLGAGFSFRGYSEELPSTGSTVCTNSEYARKHCPWTDWSGSTNAVPAGDSLVFQGNYPGTVSPVNYANLPTVSFVIPDLEDDMHDGTIQAADTWLQTNIDGYAQWAKANNSLLIVTWDENDVNESPAEPSNQIVTMFIGAGVNPGQYSEKITHYSVLRTIEDAYGLPYAGNSSSATPITDIWSTAAPLAPTNFVATAGNAQVGLTWTAPSGATSYNVYRATTSGGEGTTPIATGVTGASYTNTGLTNGTAYYYKVAAVNGNGTSPLSSEATATPIAPSCTAVPSAPVAPTASGTTSTGTSLSWSAVTPPANCTISSYEVYKNGTALASVTSGTTYAVTGLTASTTYSFTVAAVDGDGTGSQSSAVSVTTTASGGTTQLLLNPGFESGNVDWTATSGVISDNSDEPAHTGSWDAWMDGYGKTHTDTLEQQVVIPSGKTTATLSFWLHIDTAETTTTKANDTLNVEIRNSSGTVLSTLATYSNLNHNTGYTQESFNVSSYIGQTIQVYFVGTENSSLQTSFVLDDFLLDVM